MLWKVLFQRYMGRRRYRWGCPPRVPGGGGISWTTPILRLQILYGAPHICLDPADITFSVCIGYQGKLRRRYIS